MVKIQVKNSALYSGCLYLTISDKGKAMLDNRFDRIRIGLASPDLIGLGLAVR